MRREKMIAMGILGMCVLAMLAGIYLIITQERAIRPGIGLMDGVGVVRIYGPIRSGDRDVIFGRGVDRIIRAIKRIQRDPRIKAVVLRIDSPGGSVAAAQELYEAVKELRSSKRPVVVSMGEIATSGAYYVACGADRIVANPGTLTGSIGVIMAIPNAKELLGRFGMRIEVIKSGKHKDIGAIFKDMSQEERSLLEGIITDVYDQFYNVVLSSRRLNEEGLKAIADGRIFTGEQAKRVGLVDEIGTFEDAITIAARLGGIKGEPRVYEEDILPFGIFLEELGGRFFQDPLNELHKKGDWIRLEYRYLHNKGLE